MGRLVTGAINPVVLYVSGGNTQVRKIYSFLSNVLLTSNYIINYKKLLCYILK